MLKLEGIVVVEAGGAPTRADLLPFLSGLTSPWQELGAGQGWLHAQHINDAKLLKQSSNREPKEPSNHNARDFKSILAMRNQVHTGCPRVLTPETTSREPRRRGLARLFLTASLNRQL